MKSPYLPFFAFAALTFPALPLAAATHASHPKAKPNAELPTPTTLASLTTPTPTGNLMQAKDGNFYGVTNDGTASGSGTLYMVTPSGAYTVVKTFTGLEPAGGVIQGSDGNLYGLLTDNTFEGSGELFVYNISRQTVIGTYPLAGNGGESLTQDSQGNLYGITTFGGDDGLGSVFRVTLNPNPDGYPPNAPTITTVASFTTNFTSNDPGLFPLGTPLVASDGYLYGTTDGGEGSDDGAVWALNIGTPVPESRASQESAPIFVGSFLTLGVSGPIGGITEAADGNLYGVVNTDGTNGYAALYQVNLSSDTLSLFHAYSSTDQNSQIESGAPLATSTGDVITAGLGGVGYGAVTDVIVSDPSGDTYADLFEFGGSGGVVPYATPSAGFISNTEGALIGTTKDGGDNNDGTVYAFLSAFTPAITLTTSTTTLEAGSPITLNWAVNNAFSDSAQVCYANSSDYTFSGAVATSGSVSVTPKNPGGKQYSVTCGGVETATLNLTVTNGTIAVTDVNGNALSTLSYNFGAPYIAAPTYASAGYTIKLTNNTLTPYPFALTDTGVDARNFPYTTTCSATLQPQASCTVTFTFYSPGTNGNYSNTFALAKQGFLFSPGNTGTLTARAGDPDRVTLNASYHNYGMVPTGSTSSYTFTLANAGNKAQPFTVTVQQVKGPMGTSSYSTTCASPIPAGTVCTLTYNLNVPAAGSYEVLLDVPQAAFVQPNIPLYATAGSGQ